MLIFCLLGEKEKKRIGQGAFFPGWDTHCWLCFVGFLQLFGANKG
jgi:hypothetical protein